MSDSESEKEPALQPLSLVQNDKMEDTIQTITNNNEFSRDSE